MLVAGTVGVLLFAAAAHGQSAAKDDHWAAPAPASSGSYGSSANVPREQAGSFRFKSDDKSYKPFIRMRSPPRSYGRPRPTCDANPTASSCLEPSTKPVSER